MSDILNFTRSHVMTYRIYSNKRRGAYLIFRATSPWRRLFEGCTYLNIIPDKSTFSIFLFNGELIRVNTVY